ncbi:unnamed protein product [Mytilus coruscus]|uniref:Uncharacterized protein n=1 Tax=Mytilus coruscus TaxID=42192 RepID=A0A6J8AEJ3_MYTCO|nr:unnamed protein product [Mytilus coruscus]
MPDIEEKLKIRHPIATLAYNITKEDDLPSYATIDVKFSPKYGSERAKTFINNKLKDISSILRKKFREELVKECNSFIAELNTEINEVVNDTKKEIGYTIQQSAIGRAMLKRKTDELKNIWELKYKESISLKEEETLETRELDSGKFLDINRKLENLEKLISHGRGGRGRGTRYRGNRNFPY